MSSPEKVWNISETNDNVAQLAGAVEYIDCMSAEG